MTSTSEAQSLVLEGSLKKSHWSSLITVPVLQGLQLLLTVLILFVVLGIFASIQLQAHTCRDVTSPPVVAIDGPSPTPSGCFSKKVTIVKNDSLVPVHGWNQYCANYNCHFLFYNPQRVPHEPQFQLSGTEILDIPTDLGLKSLSLAMRASGADTPPEPFEYSFNIWVNGMLIPDAAASGIQRGEPWGGPFRNMNTWHYTFPTAVLPNLKRTGNNITYTFGSTGGYWVVIQDIVYTFDSRGSSVQQ